MVKSGEPRQQAAPKVSTGRWQWHWLGRCPFSSQVPARETKAKDAFSGLGQCGESRSCLFYEPVNAQVQGKLSRDQVLAQLIGLGWEQR